MEQVWGGWSYPPSLPASPALWGFGREHDKGGRSIGVEVLVLWKRWAWHSLQRVDEFSKSLLPWPSPLRIREAILILPQVWRDSGILPHVNKADRSSESSSTLACEQSAGTGKPMRAPKGGSWRRICLAATAQRAWNPNVRVTCSLKWPMTPGFWAHTYQWLSDLLPTRKNRNKHPNNGEQWTCALHFFQWVSQALMKKDQMCAKKAARVWQREWPWTASRSCCFGLLHWCRFCRLVPCGDELVFPGSNEESSSSSCLWEYLWFFAWSLVSLSSLEQLSLMVFMFQN